MAAHQAPPSLGFSRQEHWSGLPFPLPMHESEKWKWSRSVVSDPQRPHGLQPTRPHRPWDSPGKNTGVGCHFLFQCMKVKSENEVVQSCLTLSDPMDCSLPGSSVHGIFQGCHCLLQKYSYLLLNITLATPHKFEKEPVQCHEIESLDSKEKCIYWLVEDKWKPLHISLLFMSPLVSYAIIL